MARTVTPTFTVDQGEALAALVRGSLPDPDLLPEAEEIRATRLTLRALAALEEALRAEGRNRSPALAVDPADPGLRRGYAIPLYSREAP